MYMAVRHNSERMEDVRIPECSRMPRYLLTLVAGIASLSVACNLKSPQSVPEDVIVRKRQCGHVEGDVQRLRIVVEQVEPVLIEGATTREGYLATVRFECLVDTKVKLPFAEYMLESGMIESTLDYDVKDPDTCMDYWSNRVARPYAIMFQEEMVWVSRERPVVATFYLPFELRGAVADENRGRVTFRIRVGSSVSEWIDIDWFGDRESGRFVRHRSDPKALKIMLKHRVDQAKAD